jgi:phosphoribosylamine---glycine ligase
VKVLLVGGGGREHAIAWKLTQDNPAIELIATPGNPGIGELAACHPIAATDIPGLATIAEKRQVDLTVVGPEAPLAAGIVDEFQRRGLPIFGPTRDAARIESSKRFAKELMLGAGIPTAKASWHRRLDTAKAACRIIGAPVVVKASGLAAGKGVVICESIPEADAAIDSMLRDHVFGTSGDEILVEDFMQGEELSVFAVSDGESFVTMLPAQDHKRLLANDRGPNTGGMGAYAPVSIASQRLMDRIRHGIIGPTIAALREHGSEFRGLLYCGLMLTSDGPKVVEFNCRFGDPETEAILPLMQTDLLGLLLLSTQPRGLKNAPRPTFLDLASVTTVIAAPGYPDAPETGAQILIPEVEPGVHVFHAGTKRAPDGALLTAGGRVLAVTAVAPTIEEAQQRSATAAEQVRFPGRQFRPDIGWREIRRHAGVA